jgi:hypothetical protein
LYSNESTGQNDTNLTSEGNESTSVQENGTELPNNASVDGDGEQATTGLAKLIDEVVEIQIKAKVFYDMKTRMTKKAKKVDKKLKLFRPHIQHLVLYQCYEVKQSLFQTITNRDKKTGGCITILPFLTTTKRRVCF